MKWVGSATNYSMPERKTCLRNAHCCPTWTSSIAPSRKATTPREPRCKTPTGSSSTLQRLTEATAVNANHLRPLEHYDAERFGPILGVSDVGSGVAEIVRAADASAKAAAATSALDVVGVIVDGERMTS